MCPNSLLSDDKIRPNSMMTFSVSMQGDLIREMNQHVRKLRGSRSQFLRTAILAQIERDRRIKRVMPEIEKDMDDDARKERK